MSIIVNIIVIKEYNNKGSLAKKLVLQIITFQQKDSYLFPCPRVCIHLLPRSFCVFGRLGISLINMLTDAHHDRPTLHCLMTFVKDYVVQTGFLA